MQLTVHYLGQLQSSAGIAAETVEVAEPCMLAELLRLVGERHNDSFRALLGQKAMLFFVNDVHAELTRPLQAGDDVAILAPVAGG